MKKTNILPLAAMEKLLKKARAQRVSRDAELALRGLLEQHALSIGARAVLLAKHSGRKTVKAVDVKLAKTVS